MFKLLYSYMMGYEVDFGHMEAMNLITAQKYSEKQVGYLWATVLLNEVQIFSPFVLNSFFHDPPTRFHSYSVMQNNDFLRLVINSIRNDIISRNETHQSLALTCVANGANSQRYHDSTYSMT